MNEAPWLAGRKPSVGGKEKVEEKSKKMPKEQSITP